MSTSPPFAEYLRLLPTDAKWLAALHAACFPETRCWNEQMFQSSLFAPQTLGLALQENHHPLAFILLGLAADEAEILTVATHPDHMRQGCAAKLLVHAVDELKTRGIHKIFLEVATDNAPAIAFYEKHGFTNVGQRKNYYPALDGTGHNVDAIVMARDLMGV